MTPQQKYRASAKGKQTRRARELRPEYKVKKREYDATPERRAFVKMRNSSPERRLAEKLRNSRPERKQAQKNRNALPEILERRRLAERENYRSRGSRWLNATTHTVKKRARAANVRCDIAAVRAALLSAPSHCPILGFELTVGAGFKDSSTTVDRFKPELGYVESNITVISLLANRIKTNATAEQVRAVANWMEKMEQRI